MGSENDITQRLNDARHLGRTDWSWDAGGPFLVSGDHTVIGGTTRLSLAEAKAVVANLDERAALADRLRASISMMRATAPPSSIKRPPHYAAMSLQPFDAARAWGLGLSLGSAIKYVARHKLKGDPIGDLRKAINCIEDEIRFLEREDAK